MELFTKITDLKAWNNHNKKAGKTIGFVPTMGFLHEGHLSLIAKAKQENDIVIVSVFVNPLQFGVGEDYEHYPKNFDRDFKLAKDSGVDAFFFPTVEEMYPRKMSATLVVHEGTDILCGAKRPGHFDGVATVVLKLFHITSPDRAYFGMKDAQQVAVIEKMVADYHLDIEIVRCPTLREVDGLAKSSRNVNLTDSERMEAPIIYKILQKTKSYICEGEIRSFKEVKTFLNGELAEKVSGTVDYGEVLTYPQLTKPTVVTGEIIIAVAVKYSKARLIDNIILTIE